MRHLLTIFFGLALTGLGLFAGRYIASPGSESVETDVPEPHATEDAAPGTLSDQTLRALGVKVEPAQRSDFVRTRPVQAVVVDRPLNDRPVTAPLGGLVVELAVDVGDVAAPGAPLLVIARDPIPRPKPELTADLLAPLNEAVHEIAARLRSAAGQVELTERELARIQPFLEDRTIPLKAGIDLRYALERQKQELRNARADLELHGLVAAEIRAVEQGEHPPPSRQLWRRVLEENGLWPAEAEALHGLLLESECACDLPWCVAAIGELVSTGLATPALVVALREDPTLRTHFADVAGLLLDGMPLSTIRALAREGALEPDIVVRGPPGPAAGWDVTSVAIRVGQRVDAGAELLALHDAARMWLELQPVGAEIPLVVRAVEAGTQLRARPLVEGSGPVLEDVTLERMATHADEAGRGGGALAVVENRVLDTGGTGGVRSWALRTGLRYLVEVPVARLPGRYVLPFDAVTQLGQDRVVFLADGNTFRPQPVVVEYEDDRIVVLADDGSLFDGDPVVTHGAFALGLALGQSAQTADPHAGHSHN